MAQKKYSALFGFFFIIFQGSSLFRNCLVNATADPIVEISDGKLRGTITKNYNGETVYTFLGIPYGKAPIGDLRFKAPLPAEPWTGIRDAVEDGNVCYQMNTLAGNVLMGSEDCLYLNVFTKNFSGSKPLKPVLVFLHGGGFSLGSSDSKEYSPAFLITEDIVFVSLNYRLGVLGFLSLNDTSLGVPGNAGMKDQVLALKWIKKNIKKFGGDPNKVTISGESAGGASVNYHMLSPSSKGLFHKGIMQSGTVLNPWPHLNPKYLDILKYLNNSGGSDSEILEFLRNVPVRELVEAQNEWADNLVDSTFRWFAPTVEKPNDSAFLTRQPIDVITSGDYHKVPVIIGYNSNEGLYSVVTDNATEEIDSDNIIPQQIVLPDDSELRNKLLQKINRVYTSEKYANNKYLANGDSMFAVGTVALVQHLVESSPEPVYFYVLDLITSRNLFRRMFNMGEEYIGASHADDLGYLFDSPNLQDIPILPGSIEELAIFRFVKFWGNFVKYGNPTPENNALNFKWKPVKNGKLNYLHIGKDLAIKTNPLEERLQLWRKIYSFNEDTQDFLL